MKAKESGNNYMNDVGFFKWGMAGGDRHGKVVPKPQICLFTILFSSQIGGSSLCLYAAVDFVEVTA